jgi:uncharacterized protein YrrD
MLCSIKELDGFSLAARDGDIGHVSEVYFDDVRWGIRHLVADTGGWLSTHKVLISPHSIGAVDAVHRRLNVALTRQQIKEAPGIDTDKPVSRQHEMSYYDYYGYPYYWTGAGLWGAEAFPLGGEAMAMPAASAVPPDVARDMAAAEQQTGDPHLRSSDEVKGYAIEASDGSIGHIDDFLFDDRSWQIRFAVVDTRNWLPGRLVLLSPQWIGSIDWSEHRAHVKVSREAVKASPPYERNTPLSEEEMLRVQRHYEGWQ